MAVSEAHEHLRVAETSAHSAYTQTVAAPNTAVLCGIQCAHGDEHAPGRVPTASLTSDVQVEIGTILQR